MSQREKNNHFRPTSFNQITFPGVEKCTTIIKWTVLVGNAKRENEKDCVLQSSEAIKKILSLPVVMHHVPSVILKTLTVEMS